MSSEKEKQPIIYKLNPYDVIVNNFGVSRTYQGSFDNPIFKPKEILEENGLKLYEHPYFSVIAIATNEDLITNATESLAQWLMYKRGDDFDATHTGQDRLLLAMCATFDVAYLEALLISKPDADEAERERIIRNITKLQTFKNDLLEQFPH